MKLNKKGSGSLIIKPRETPTLMLQTEALNKRLSSDHRNKQYINRQATNLRTGYNGEKSIDFVLRFLPNRGLHILHNLRIPDIDGHFQIDTLIITSYFTLIIEVKNVYGTITFDEMGQAIRTTDEIEEGFNNPIDQVNLQRHRLLRWLRQHKIPPIPLERLVVYSNPHTILKNITNSKLTAESVIHKGSLLSRVEEFFKIHKTLCIPEKQINVLTSQLIASHTARKVNIMKHYQVSYEELLRGVICPNCGTFPMLRKNGKWWCAKCENVSKNAHLAALEDYNFLIGNTIKNQQARHFLQLESIHVTKQLLQKARFEQNGSTSARKYRLDRRS